jgi:hypothetical protein
MVRTTTGVPRCRCSAQAAEGDLLIFFGADTRAFGFVAYLIVGAIVGVLTVAALFAFSSRVIAEFVVGAFAVGGTFRLALALTRDGITELIGRAVGLRRTPGVALASARGRIT